VTEDPAWPEFAEAEPEPGSEPAPLRQPGLAWQWGKTGQTQQALLDAAREEFSERGFTQAKVVDIAARVGMTPGVIYHHFGGKNELYLALWRRHTLAHQEAAERAVAKARQEGVTDRAELWAAGTRAVLRGTWVRKDLAALFFAGNGPPGFEAMRRGRHGYWDRGADALLKVTEPTPDRLFGAILTAVVGEGARAITAARNRKEADAIIEDVIEYAKHLIAGGPAKRQTTDPASTGAPPEATDRPGRTRRRGSGQTSGAGMP
jgi:AcrR family transcriptional regulator